MGKAQVLGERGTITVNRKIRKGKRARERGRMRIGCFMLRVRFSILACCHTRNR
jgi:hypothetical protein